MKRFLIVAVAAIAAILFTACPDKPKDEPVVIPDGTYEETAHYIVYRAEGGNQILETDTTFTTKLIIASGEFIYEDMCSEVEKNINVTNYRPHFIYLANYYCPIFIYENSEWHHYSDPLLRTPNVSQDGFVVIKSPCFINGTSDIVDENYVYNAIVKKNGDCYLFEQIHSFESRKGSKHNYKISHTLIPLTD